MPTSQYSVDGQTVVVTGSSRGIGRAIAKTFASDGADVVVCAPRTEQEELQATVAEFNGLDASGRTIAVESDVTNRSDVERLAERAVDEFGSIDALVNNVGGGHHHPFEDTPVTEWTRVLDQNITATFNATQLLGESLQRGNGGAVINIASMAGVEGLPYKSAYGLAKAGIINLTRTLAYEWALEDVRVNAIAPGIVATDRIGDITPMPLPDKDDIDRDEVARRVGTPEEIADIAQMLASPAASFLTGEVIEVRGPPRLERELHVTADLDGVSWNW